MAPSPNSASEARNSPLAVAAMEVAGQLGLGPCILHWILVSQRHSFCVPLRYCLVHELLDVRNFSPYDIRHRHGTGKPETLTRRQGSEIIGASWKGRTHSPSLLAKRRLAIPPRGLFPDLLSAAASLLRPLFSPGANTYREDRHAIRPLLAMQ